MKTFFFFPKDLLAIELTGLDRTGIEQVGQIRPHKY